ncbi:dGTP triphosphohydrolase [Sphingomonas sp. CFBP 8760]|uniref:dGTP triphosphohydrolase n=1 Tax=Sphingomonas sp. CFBP 8760 TaxID=2775282 RepID=UPI00177F4299|nr:dNTP triphosphohydrolase [Sphingomonas sp. CFBP 8760]
MSNLARSIGTRVAGRIGDGAFGGMDLHETVQPILSAIGLAHDLGNPPFGHQGEAAICRWFERRREWIFTHVDDRRSETLEDPVNGRQRAEFTSFDGNPQTLRIVTRLQTSHHHVGLDLTAATLTASLKYPVDARHASKDNAAVKKAGYFESERDVVEWIRPRAGLAEGQRHPLTWIMEACDDIAYSVLDVDDLLKKGIISPDDVLVVLKHTALVADLPTVKALEVKFDEINRDARRAEIRRDIKEQYVRAYMIKALIDDAGGAYAAQADRIERYEMILPLMDNNALCDTLKDIAGRYGFANPAVLRSEAFGAAAIDGLITVFWSAIHNRKDATKLMSKRQEAQDRYALSLISPNYLESACREAKASGGATGRVGRYHELRLLTDMISGMTDGFATDVWRDLQQVPL